MARVADAHYAHAKAAGVRVGAAPATYPYGGRRCSAVDPGGHAWTFSQTVQDVDPNKGGGEIVHDK